jgi:predicted transposase YdaD
MTQRPLQRHDQFFQRLLEKPGGARMLLRERLLPEVAALLVDEPPELLPGSFVSPRLRRYHTDRLYKSQTIDARSSGLSGISCAGGRFPVIRPSPL